MTKQPEIAPSILSGDFANMGKTVRDVCAWGADYVHVDVMDGVFVKNLTFGMPMVRAIKPHSALPLDVHLMIIDPERYIDEFIRAGADIISFHPNAGEHTREAVDTIRAAGAKAGLAINPDIPLDAVIPYLPKLDQVVLMGVYAGFGGQKYNVCVDEKISKLRKIIDDNGYRAKIEIDGGVTEENARGLIDLGADILVGGSSVFGSSDAPRTIRRLRGEIC